MVHAYFVIQIVKDVLAIKSASTVNKVLFSSIHRAYSRSAHSHAPLVKDLQTFVFLVHSTRLKNTIFMRINAYKLVPMVVLSGKMSLKFSILEFA
jgi:hypothetical protein